MTLAIDDGDVRIYLGDALEQLATLPSESVQCIVTSPPFWALRDYGTGRWEGGDDPGCDHSASKPSRKANAIATSGLEGGKGTVHASLNYGATCGRCGATRIDGQIGLEATPDEWCERLVGVFRECRRVLRNDGVLWLEVGDTYASNGERATGRNDTDRPTPGGAGGSFRGGAREPLAATTPGIKPKDLVGAPWMLAFALRNDGWYLRSDTIWARPNPMPESVTDRPTKAHSYVFLLTKQARYFFDADAVREPYDARPQQRLTANIDMPKGKARVAAGVQQGNPQGGVPGAGRNIRSVWSIATEPTPFAHFATFPQSLVERCIKAGTSDRGCCVRCQAPWVRKTESELVKSPKHSKGSVVRGRGEGTAVNGWAGEAMPRLNRQVTTTGWAPSCECDAAFAASVPCTVLDPFMGSGTTALVARRLGRHAIGIELNAEYLAIAAKRLQQLSLLGGSA